MIRIIALAAAAVGYFAFGPTAQAAVESRAENSFVLSFEGVAAIPPEQADERFLRVQDWWSDAHTYSGEAGNLRIEKRPGGCWCERLAGGGFVEHMRLTQRLPGSSLMLVGGLGPLAAMGAQGALTVGFAKADDGARVTWRYVVSGPGVGAVAEAVDAVLNEQFNRYVDAAPSREKRPE